MPIWGYSYNNIYALAIAVYYELGGGLTLACPLANTGQVGIPYSSSLIASGGTPPYTFAIISGSLPPGLTLNASTGVISGTPTTVGTSSYTAQVTDSVAATATASCSITISAPTLSLACPLANTGTLSVFYSSALIAVGGTPPYTFSILGGILPLGLLLNPASGVISGIPVLTGTFPYQPHVVDSVGAHADASCQIVISASTPSGGGTTCSGATICGNMPNLEVTRDLDADWSDESTFYITQDDPLPFTVRALVLRMSYNQD